VWVEEKPALWPCSLLRVEFVPLTSWVKANPWFDGQCNPQFMLWVKRVPNGTIGLILIMVVMYFMRGFRQIRV